MFSLLYWFSSYPLFLRINCIHFLQFSHKFLIALSLPRLRKQMLSPLMHQDITLNTFSFSQWLYSTLSFLHQFFVLIFIEFLWFYRTTRKGVKLSVIFFRKHLHFDVCLKLSLLYISLPIVSVNLCIFQHLLVLCFEFLLYLLCFICPFFIIILVLL